MIRIGVIGAGRWGMNLIRTFQELGHLYAVAETSTSLRSALAVHYPQARLYASHKDLLESGAEAVIIAAPATDHYPLAKQSLEQGLDVFMEKPMTLTSAEAEDLVQIAKGKGRVLMVGHLLVHQPAVQWIRKAIGKGMIGRVHSLAHTRRKLGKIRKAENVLWSLGVHDLAVCLHLLDADPVEVKAYGKRLIQRDIEDEVELHLTFPYGVKASLYCSWLWPEQERRLLIRGTEGMFVYEEEHQTVTLHRKWVKDDLNIEDKNREVVFTGHAQPLLLECRHFIDCVKNRAVPLTDGESGAAVIRVLEQAMQEVD